MPTMYVFFDRAHGPVTEQEADDFAHVLLGAREGLPSRGASPDVEVHRLDGLGGFALTGSEATLALLGGRRSPFKTLLKCRVVSYARAEDLESASRSDDACARCQRHSVHTLLEEDAWLVDPRTSSHAALLYPQEEPNTQFWVHRSDGQLWRYGTGDQLANLLCATCLDDLVAAGELEPAHRDVCPRCVSVHDQVVTCKVCGSEHCCIMGPTQGDDCASSCFFKNGKWWIAGSYGSSHFDMTLLEFLAEPPEAYKNADPICDDCVQKLVDAEHLRERGDGYLGVGWTLAGDPVPL